MIILYVTKIVLYIYNFLVPWSTGLKNVSFFFHLSMYFRITCTIKNCHYFLLNLGAHHRGDEETLKTWPVFIKTKRVAWVWSCEHQTLVYLREINVNGVTTTRNKFYIFPTELRETFRINLSALSFL